MNVQEAARIAMNYVYEMESITSTPTTDAEQKLSFLANRRFAIEGARFQEDDHTWFIEVGFTRPWDQAPSTVFASMTGASNPQRDNRTIKTVIISDDNQEVLSYD